MANKYVRAGATGDGSGSDWTNAYTNIPTDSLVRGDTYYVADGSYTGPDDFATFQFATAMNGTQTITIKKATVADHGTETGWDNSYGDGIATLDGSLVFMRDYFIVNGVTRNESDWTQQVYGFRVTGSVLMVWPDNFPPGGNHVYVYYCDVGGTVGNSYPSIEGEPIYIVTNSSTQYQDFLVSRCYIHNCTLAQLVGVDGMTYEYCYFKDMWAKEAIRGSYGCKNIIIRYNVFQDTTRDTGIPGDGGTAPIAIWTGDTAGIFDGIEVYGNIFWNTEEISWSGGCVVLGGDGVNWVGVAANNCKIYNNTVVGANTGSPSYFMINGGNNNVIINNLHYDCSQTGATITGGGTGNTTSNNVVAASNPFVSYTSGGTTADLHLSAAQAGTSLSSTYNQDLEGNTRGSDGTWDVGAYEYVASAGGSDPTPVRFSVIGISTASGRPVVTRQFRVRG
jgi:hypothetical protein